METLGNIFGAEKGKKGHFEYYCERCDFYCSKKYGWERHIITAKHTKETNGNVLETKKGRKGQNKKCEFCCREFNSRSGLWKHIKNCKIEMSYSEKENKKYEEVSDKEIIMMLLKENSEVKTMMKEQQQMMMKIIEHGTHNTTTNNTNSHNKSFNLQFFLNETCKDAMNIMDFVDSIKLQLSDLERVGEIGFVDGISNIIVKNLKELDVTERPIHCTDKKREILYVKNEDKWEKEDNEKKKIRKVIKNVANKNILLLQKFKEAHPDCGKSISKFSDQYNKIVVEAMGGYGDNDYEKEEKIIQKISKNVTIDNIKTN
jgi:hypothetical protein